MKRRTLRRSATLALVVGLSVLVVPAAAAPSRVVLDDLFNPRGLDGTPGHRLVVAESGSGEITEINWRGENDVPKTLATLPADPDKEFGPVDVAQLKGGLLYVVISGAFGGGVPNDAQLVRLRRNGSTKVVADIGAYQESDPDPEDIEGNPTESNPNGLAVLPDGDILVVDAANNDLLRVTKNGQITTVARFPVEIVPMPPGFPSPPFPPAGTPIPAESVPTAVAIGPDKAWYVSELKGFPFAPGSSKIWRVEPGSEDVTCPSAACTVFAEGFTSVIDLTFRDGTMYVLEIVKAGLLSEGPPIGALWAVSDGSRTELAPGTLLFPGGVVVGSKAAFVTTGAVFGPGAGAVVRIELE